MTIEAVWGDGVPKPKMAYSPAIRAGDWLFVAGQLASDFATGVPAEVVPANEFLVSPLETQGSYVLGNIAGTIAPTGRSMTDVVRLSRWFTGSAAQAAGDTTWPGSGVDDYLVVEAAQLDGANTGQSTLGIDALMWTGTQVEIDVICRLDDQPSQPVLDPTDSTTRGIRRGDWVFLSSHCAPTDPATSPALPHRPRRSSPIWPGSLPQPEVRCSAR